MSQDWTTANEIGYLRTLGNKTLGGKDPWLRATLLRNYLTANRHRKDWGRIDRRRAQVAALSMLVEVEQSRCRPTQNG